MVCFSLVMRFSCGICMIYSKSKNEKVKGKSISRRYIVVLLFALRRVLKYCPVRDKFLLIVLYEFDYMFLCDEVLFTYS